jgi:predicted nucleic-acid-binding Zn-ribbon protein
MRANHRCPKCNCQKLFVVEKVMQRNEESVNGTHALTPMAVWLPTGERGLLGEKSARLEAGTFEIWICSACGLTEWYAKDANEMLAYFARFHDGGVRVVDGEAGKAPYR